MLLSGVGVAVGVGCSSSDNAPTTPGTNDGGGGSDSAATDGGASNPCAAHTDCEECILDRMNGCSFCAGSCQVNPAPKDDKASWCSYGYAAIGTGLCTALDGGALLPTTLPVDCRAPANTADPRCIEGGDSTATKVGAGPAFPDGAISALQGGFLDPAGNRFVLGAFYNNSNTDARHGAILSVDLATGNRTLVSATYVDARQTDIAVGTGPDLPGVVDVKPSPDGKIWWALTGYAGNKHRAIFKIDPANGARTMFYDGETGVPKCQFAGQNWTLIDVLNRISFAVTADGDLLVPTAEDAATSSIGIARVKPAGTCSIISMASNTAANKLGTGPLPYHGYTGLVLNGTTLYAESGREIFAIDIANGNRTFVSSTSATPQVGSGPPFQEGYLHAGAAGTLIASGPSTSQGTGPIFAFYDVDIATGNRTPHGYLGAPFPHVLSGQRSLEPYPAKPGIYIGYTVNAVILFDPLAGASMVLSH